MQYLQNQKLQEERGRTEEGKQCSQTRIRILLVDDEPDTCMSYQMVLQNAGYECNSYTDSVKALKEFRPNYYDICLLDIKMPMLNGFELCKKIREIDKSLYVIFITAAAEYYEKFRSRHYAAITNNSNNTSFIQKPIGNKELIQLVNMTISTKDAN
jgi:DNA-binding response OmpR family regulator